MRNGNDIFRKADKTPRHHPQGSMVGNHDKPYTSRRYVTHNSASHHPHRCLTLTGYPTLSRYTEAHMLHFR